MKAYEIILCNIEMNKKVENVNFFFRFGKTSIEKVCRLLYPLIFILVCMRLYFVEISMSMGDFLYDKMFLQHLLLQLRLIYFLILEPILILILIKLSLELVLLFYKKNEKQN